MAPVFELSDEMFVIDLAQARNGALDPATRAEVVGCLRRLIAEFDILA
jgi:hypothetical protein